MLELHRHDEFSLFDGFGKAAYCAEVAKDLGYTALGIANHGNTHGLIEHWNGCKLKGINPILGVEAYFQPKFNKDKKRYHLCLFAKNRIGYTNLMRLTSYAFEHQFYRVPRVTISDLKKYHEGIICTSACIASYSSQMIVKGKDEKARKCLETFKKIFGNDFYIEIMPYKIDKKLTQETVNEKLMEFAKELNIKCILTTDSHYPSKNDYDTYMIMHQIADHNMGDTYKERFIPSKKELYRRYLKMHYGANFTFNDMMNNAKEIEDKCDYDYIEEIGKENKIPHLFSDKKKAYEKIKRKVKKGLMAKGKWDKAHAEKCMKELKIIKHHGFEDYFLIVQDYVKWAKKRGIGVGPGRGSVCNSNVAFALDITKVDPVYFNLDFQRFLRKDKKKLPDIDLDFETKRRQEVLDYLVQKYGIRSAQICSYGLFRVDILINDLCKVLEVPEHEKSILKAILRKEVEIEADYNSLIKIPDIRRINNEYDEIVKHFCKLHMQVRYIGKHAAGVAIVNDKLRDYVAVKDNHGRPMTTYDLNNLGDLSILKFDILGLKTMSEIAELESLTGVEFDYSMLEDERIYEEFRKGETDGIFQFERKAAKEILKKIETDGIEDVIAASALNRPAPLKLKMPEQYAQNKKASKDNKPIWYEYIKDTHGTIIYQEQVIAICRNIGMLSWADTDKVMKMMKGGKLTEAYLKAFKENHDRLQNLFSKNANERYDISIEEGEHLFDDLTRYLFNKGHATGYGIISIQQMYYKIYHPLEFWYVKLKNESLEQKQAVFKSQAVKNDIVVLLPHVNQTAECSIRTVDGEKCIQLGMVEFKNVGLKAAQYIEDERRLHGDYTSKEDFLSRVPKRTVNSRCVDMLETQGALQFNKKILRKRNVKYNTSLLLKAMR